MTTQYDEIIKQSTEEYLPGTDWRLLKAQLMAESSLNPNAISPANAMGIAQFMPKTWEDIKKQMKLPSSASPFDTEYAIPACAYYMRTLYDDWSVPRPDADRYCLALASYNAGIGNILEAQRIANNARGYHEIISQLHQVTGDNANETTNYVRRVLQYWVNYVIDPK